MARSKADFILSQPFVEERTPEIGDTVVLVYAEFTNKAPDIGVLIPGGNDHYRILIGERIILWDRQAPIYVIDKNWV
jgi:hypothetical protein